MSNHRMKPIEIRYRKALDLMRSLRSSKDTKAIEKDISHLMYKIESYGFKFFPNHYIFDDVIQFEKLVHEMKTI